MPDKAKIAIVTATSGDDFKAARSLFQEYADGLGVDLCFQNFADELANNEKIYSSPTGALLLAICDQQIAGCVAVRRLKTNICEMKRLYVKPGFQNLKIGRMLAIKIIEKSRELGYERMRLDTLPQMARAQNLYRSLGFREISAYRYNPDEDTVFMELD